jgi:hypothetical protein
VSSASPWIGSCSLNIDIVTPGLGIYWQDSKAITITINIVA